MEFIIQIFIALSATIGLMTLLALVTFGLVLLTKETINIVKEVKHGDGKNSIPNND